MIQIETKVLSRFLLASLACSTLSIEANANAILRCSKSNLSKNAKEIQTIAIIDQESRSTFAEFARKNNVSLKELYRSYGATGYIECGGRQVTAHLVGNQKTVVSIGHFFYDDNCNPKRFSSCDFYTFESETKHKRHRIKSWASGGCNGQHNGKWADDWTVFELDDEVASTVKPYIVSEKPAQPTDELPIVQVSSFSRNFRVDGKYPRHLTNCSYRKTNIGSRSGHLTDCDAGTGSSGSAHVVPTAKGAMLLGMAVGSASDNMNYKPYDPLQNATVSLPIEGKFHATIQSVVQKTGGPSR